MGGRTGAGPRFTCGVAGVSSPLDRASAEDVARLLKAVADPARLQLISLLRAQPAGEACVCDLTEAVALSQATVSHHLKVLVDAGVLVKEKRGYWNWYALVPARLQELAAVLA